MTDKHEKIIDRIRKLLAMAGDTSSPQEAAIAARRARKLMDEYQISEIDLSTVADSDFGPSIFDLGTRNAVSAAGTLAIAVAELNDCQVCYERTGKGTMGLRFEGFLSDTVCCVELYRWLRDEMYRQAEQYTTGRGPRNSYRTGFAAGVLRQAREIVAERTRDVQASNGQALVVAKSALVRQHYGAVKYGRASRNTYDSRAHDAGYSAGKSANLSRQVNGATARRIAG